MTFTRRLGLVVASAGVGLILVASPASARPCDGCVGNADNKAPKGQSVGDKNHGYECDDNHGVGDGNPAHTADCDGDGGGGTTAS